MNPTNITSEFVYNTLFSSYPNIGLRRAILQPLKRNTSDQVIIMRDTLKAWMKNKRDVKTGDNIIYDKFGKSFILTDIDVYGISYPSTNNDIITEICLRLYINVKNQPYFICAFNFDAQHLINYGFPKSYEQYMNYNLLKTL